MSDEIEIEIERLIEVQAPDPDALSSAPVIDRWQIRCHAGGGTLFVAGLVAGRKGMTDGSEIVTSAVIAVGIDRRWVRTRNTLYRLGWPATHWPPALAVATYLNREIAHESAWHLTGTLSEHDIADCDVAITLGKAGRARVAEAWTLLAIDLTVARDRVLARALWASIERQSIWKDLTAVERQAIAGWKTLVITTDDGLQRFGSVADPIALAHEIKLGDPLVLEEDVQEAEQQALGAKVALRDPPNKPSAPATARNYVADRLLAPLVAGLPSVPVPDVAASRRVLMAEFPQAASQIDAMLTDLVGAQFLRLRPTVLVGDPGTGKTRLARRIGEVVGLYVASFSCAGVDDGSFAGTPRRWTNAEPSLPVRTMLTARSATALVILDEIDKAGVGKQNGNLSDALLPFLEIETASRFTDPYAQFALNCSRLSYIATANDDRAIAAPLRDRLRILRIAAPKVEHLPAICRAVVADLARESGTDPRWFPPLDGDELWIVQHLWAGGSLRRVREIVSRLLLKRSEMRH